MVGKLRLQSDVQSFACSALVHVVILLVLALIALPTPARKLFDLTFRSSDPAETSLATFDLRASSFQPEPENAVEYSTDTVDVRVQPLSDLGSSEIRLPEVVAFKPAPQPSKWISRLASDSMEDAMRGELDSMAIREPSSLREISASGDPGSALDSVTSAIQGELAEGDTLVVWLLDASISLERDRALMARHMKDFYESIGRLTGTRSTGSEETLLLNSVVAFGARQRVISPPNAKGIKVVNALVEVPIDSSGQENVMTALQTVLSTFESHRQRRKRMMVVVITDESGDDTHLLEDTIRLCRYAQVAVHVVGPTAVLGAERGSHIYVVEQPPRRPQRYLLPVKRGPDSALPERLWLPYWHQPGQAPWENAGIQSFLEAGPYGGPYREGLMTAHGPYALTRLALETGGTFTILNRTNDRNAFDLEALRDYMPDYGPAQQYRLDLEENPFRRAISNAAFATFEPDNIQTFRPPRMHFLWNDRRYVAPATFKTQFSNLARIESRRARKAIDRLDQLLVPFKDPSIHWQQAHDDEPSQRWRAWHDLTKGRILANIVRYLEYENTLGQLPQSLPSGVNQLSLHPSPALAVTRSQSLAGEAHALLQRCVSDHRNTPWALLAQWELDTAMGLRFTTRAIPKPPPAPVRIGIPRAMPRTGGGPSLPNL